MAYHSLRNAVISTHIYATHEKLLEKKGYASAASRELASHSLLTTPSVVDGARDDVFISDDWVVVVVL